MQHALLSPSSGSHKPFHPLYVSGGVCGASCTFQMCAWSLWLRKQTLPVGNLWMPLMRHVMLCDLPKDGLLCYVSSHRLVKREFMPWGVLPEVVMGTLCAALVLSKEGCYSSNLDDLINQELQGGIRKHCIGLVYNRVMPCTPRVSIGTTTVFRVTCLRWPLGVGYRCRDVEHSHSMMECNIHGYRDGT